MTLAPTKFRQPSYGGLVLVGISGGVEPGNYAQQLTTLGNYINDILRDEVGNYSNSVSPPVTTTTAVPADLFQSVFNAYGTALNSCITRRTLSTTPWSTLTTLSATNWVSFYNQLASLAVAVSDAITTAGL
jgi:hypothetical protein